MAINAGRQPDRKRVEEVGAILGTALEDGSGARSAKKLTELADRISAARDALIDDLGALGALIEAPKPDYLDHSPDDESQYLGLLHASRLILRHADDALQELELIQNELRADEDSEGGRH